ncbi:MAG: hypothetical protein F4W89_17245 [Acidobacteria bacterium]|nr:hypothetical protein [Acidobacteriota bacterium]
MAHPDHLELFLQGPEAWNRRAKTTETYGWDLTRESLGYRLVERYGEGNVPSYAGINLRSVDLRDARFVMPQGMPTFRPGLDLAGAWFLGARASGVSFFNANLTDAVFTQADLRQADFSGATLDNALFHEADLTGANLTGARPWRARIFTGEPSEPYVSLTETHVAGVGDLAAMCRTLRLAHDHDADDARFYYRGQSAPWRLRPSVMRSRKSRRSEAAMLREKPRFEAVVDPRDLLKVFVVEPQQLFERIRAQSGAFLVSAFHERFERARVVQWNEKTPAYRHYTLAVPAGSKDALLEELALLGVTRESMFPGLDEAAQAITEEVMSTTERRDRSTTLWHEPRHGVDVRW